MSSDTRAARWAGRKEQEPVESDRASQSPGRGGGPQGGARPRQGALPGPEGPLRLRGLACEVRPTVSASGDCSGAVERVRACGSGGVCVRVSVCTCVYRPSTASLLHQPSLKHRGPKASVIVPI